MRLSADRARLRDAFHLDDNEAGVATGWLEGGLSEEGRALAAKLGERRREERIAAVFASDLRRAVETAQIAFATSGLPIVLDRRLRECDYGKLNGVPVQRLGAARAYPQPPKVSQACAKASRAQGEVDRREGRNHTAILTDPFDGQ